MLNPKCGGHSRKFPNNPSGTVYSEETLTRCLADIPCNRKSMVTTFSSSVMSRTVRSYLTERPARTESKFYDNTLSCYSFSKKPEPSGGAYRLRGGKSGLHR